MHIEQHWVPRRLTEKGIRQKQHKQRHTLNTMYEELCVFLPAGLVRVVGVSDNDRFYFWWMPGWKHTQGPDRRWQVLYSWCRACSCRSDVDPKPKRQTLDLARLLFEHKWATLNSNSHMTADVAAVAVVSVPAESVRTRRIIQNTVPKKIQKETCTVCTVISRHTIFISYCQTLLLVTC